LRVVVRADLADFRPLDLSRSVAQLGQARSRLAASDTRLIFESSTRGGGPPMVDGQK
jgi:hypothetical protein